MLNSNAAVLKKKYPEDYARMTEIEETFYSVEWVEARDGSEVPVVKTDGGTVRLNSIYQPVREAVKWAEQYEYQNQKTNIFMFGMGNGMFVREMISRMRPDAKMFIFEPDDSILCQVLQKLDFSEILSDERLFLIMDKGEIGGFEKAARQYIHWSTIPTQIICCHPGYDKLYQKEYLRYYSRLKRMVEEEEVVRNTNAKFSDIVIANTIKNLRFIKESNYIDEIKEKLDVAGKTAIIVAAGPSLDKNILELRKAENKAFIIAVDSVVSRLDKEGISYDCVVTIDPNKITGDLMEFDAWKDIPLFCDIASKSDILSVHRGKKIWYTGKGFLSTLYEKQGIPFTGNVKGGGSVATVAFAIAEYLGFRTIILVGQDLAYQGEATHAGGERRYYIKNEETSVMYVDAVDGQQIKSRWDWVYYRDWFERKISVNDTINVIDATEGGALIHGSVVCSLSDAIEQYSDGIFPFRETLNGILPTFDEEQAKILWKNILYIQTGLENIRNKTQDGLVFCRTYMKSKKNMTQKKRDRLIQDIGRISQYIESQKLENMMLNMYTSKLALEGIADINKVTGDEEQDEMNFVKMAQIIYNAYSDGAEEILSMMKKELK